MVIEHEQGTDSCFFLATEIWGGGVVLTATYLANPNHTKSLPMTQRFSAGGDFAPPLRDIWKRLGTFWLSQREECVNYWHLESKGQGCC